MYTYALRSLPRALLALALILAVAGVSTASAQSYEAILNGANESPPVVTTGTGTCQVDFDLTAHTMRVRASFSGLVGTTTNCHIHAPTAVAFTGTVGVATTLPTFTGFPAGVTAGTYDATFDMTLASSYSAGFLGANGGTPASAEVALHGYVAAGRAYFNVHSSFVGSGEIRGFLVPSTPTPVSVTTWGQIKALYR